MIRHTRFDCDWSSDVCSSDLHRLGRIPPEILPNLCEPFFTTRPEGTGLGLAIAKRYVEEAGGRLEIASAVGRGTTVRIWLPVMSGDTAPAPPPPPPPPPAGPPRTAPRG